MTDSFVRGISGELSTEKPWEYASRMRVGDEDFVSISGGIYKKVVHIYIFVSDEKYSTLYDILTLNSFALDKNKVWFVQRDAATIVKLIYDADHVLGKVGCRIVGDISSSDMLQKYVSSGRFTHYKDIHKAIYDDREYIYTGKKFTFKERLKVLFTGMVI